MDLALLLAFTLAVLVVSVTPGPDLVFIGANALASGRTVGVVAAAGVSTGLAVHTVAVAFGLGALIHTAPMVLDAVRIVGAGVLIVLAVAALRSSKEADGAASEATPPARSLTRTFGLATLTNLANPKVILFFLAFFPQFLTVGPGSWPVTAQLLVLGAVYVVLCFGVTGTVGALVGTMSDRLTPRTAARRWLGRAAAAVFGGLAVRLIWETASP
ncbi:LysE family translocator [Spiractinospora alimapuensis]|nr:LysE family translocator [Spiractinospora alimapuensis]